MRDSSKKIIAALIFLAAGILLYIGWKLFWFMTDDALIAFRYVSNSILGHCYVWNPPPFRPVEGYTSFLWVVLLDIIWRVFNLKPPEVVNYLSLVFSYLTLAVVALAVMRLKLLSALEKWRPLFLFLVLLGTVSNRTFLAWTSSGMETAMFNFFFVLWTLLAFWDKNRGKGWVLTWTTLAALTYLSRPDGLLTVLFTLVFLLYDRWRQKTFSAKWLLPVSPLMLVALHLGWRRYFYGEWLPNTYYAKVVARWPEAGVRYLASFVLEYALWVWIFLAIVWIFRRSKTVPAKPASRKNPRSGTGSKWVQSFLSSPSKLALTALFVHLTYYTFIIGGDHFEYRVYSYLIPLVFVSYLWLQNELGLAPKKAAALFGLFILFSWPIPWVHWQLTRHYVTRDETHVLVAPVGDRFPLFLRWYAEPFDDLQRWLISRHICMRHQEHKVFYEYHRNAYPPREKGEQIRPGGYPILASGTVGVPGWVLPHVAILDQYGLNDYVIARSPYRRQHRLMAHDRFPPPGYVESFSPNLFVESPGRMGTRKRERELTADYIIANEAFWTAEVSR